MDNLEHCNTCVPNMDKNEAYNSMYCGKYRLAQAYVIRQPYTKLYSLSEGFKKGTIFPNLYEPYK